MSQENSELLQKRARIISSKDTETIVALETAVLIVEFSLLPENYAVDASYVIEVLPFHNLTQIPGTPPFVVGLMNIRGKIISVLNLKPMLHLASKGLSSLNRVIVIKSKTMEFGIVADSILGTATIDMATLGPPPMMIPDGYGKFIQGVTSNGSVLLDAKALLLSNSIIINQK